MHCEIFISALVYLNAFRVFPASNDPAIARFILVVPATNAIPERNSVGLNPTGNFMFKVSNRNTRARCEAWSKLTIKTLASFGYLCC